MSAVKYNSFSEVKRALRDFARWYAIIIPFTCALLIIPTRKSAPVLVYAAFIFLSALLMGIFSLFARPLGGAIRSALVIGLFASVILGGITSYAWYMSGARTRFDRDMQNRYERQCDKYYDIYDSGDIESAKKALRDVIAFSLKEQSKAKYYWRFNIIIAGSEARLAIMAEAQGDKKEAERLFVSASDHQVLGEKAFEAVAREDHIALGNSDTNALQHMSPDQWRRWIAALEKDRDIKWKSTIKLLQPAAATP